MKESWTRYKHTHQRYFFPLSLLSSISPFLFSTRYKHTHHLTPHSHLTLTTTAQLGNLALDLWPPQHPCLCPYPNSLCKSTRECLGSIKEGIKVSNQAEIKYRGSSCWRSSYLQKLQNEEEKYRRKWQ